MSESACPACGQTSFELCEPVNVAEQHESYAPNDPQMQQSLTAAQPHQH